jgi:hypothetical protein
MNKWFVAMLVVAIMAALSCTPYGEAAAKGDSSKKKAPTEHKEAAPVPAPAPTAASPPAPADKKTPAAKPAEIKGPANPKWEAITNGSFEDWKDGALVGWNAMVNKGKEWKPIVVKASADAQTGKTSLELPAAPPEGQVVLSQSLSAKRIGAGRPVLLKAIFKASKPEEVHVVFSFMHKGKEVKERVFNKTAGAWEKAETPVAIPPDADPNSFRLQIFHKAGGTGSAFVDGVSVMQ